MKVNNSCTHTFLHTISGHSEVPWGLTLNPFSRWPDMEDPTFSILCRQSNLCYHVRHGVHASSQVKLL
jgi:hypothetical protein